MTLDDAILNWLQIKMVCQARPDDQPAKETEQFFMTILIEDHRVELIKLEEDETMVHFHYSVAEKRKIKMYPKDLAYYLISQIEKEPRYGV
jgi:hypothetical protein